MSSTPETQKDSQLRTYERATSVVFLKTNEEFGGLSNMAGGFPLKVNGLRILTSEALYQACRFPHRPEVQRFIIEQASPMTAKMKSKRYRGDSRPDWDWVRVKIMRWCLRVKLAQNWDAFSELLLQTGDRAIVEQSRKDDFWGAKEMEDGTLGGRNVLGRLLMELREAVKTVGRDTLWSVEPLQILDFLLDGQPIGIVQPGDTGNFELSPSRTGDGVPGTAASVAAPQASLFDQPVVKETSTPENASKGAKNVDIADLKPYPAYKDSGVPWLGEVPEHWAVERLKSSVSNVIEQTAERDDTDLYVALEHVESWTGRLRHAGSDVTFDSQVKRFRSGDVLFGKLRPYLAKVTRPRSGGVCVGEFFVLRPRNSSVAPPYVEQMLRSKPIIDAINSSTFGAKMPRADWQFVGGMSVPLPPIPEQSAIVRFLDHVDRRIRRYIHAKQKLIRLLEEQKQAIIHRAVTHGLDPNVRLKSSGVEWLGDVPEHWEVLPLRRVTIARCDGPFGSGLKSSHYTNDGIRVIRLQNIGHAEFRDSEASFIAQAHYVTLGDHSVEAGDLLIAGLGDERHPAGRACVAPARIVPAMVKADCFRFRLVSSRMNSDFAALHLTATAIAASANLSTGATRQRTNLQSTSARRICVPPIPEQGEIVAAISSDTALLKSAIDRAQRETSLLREYRTRLIADAVTGKLDVREAAGRLPDETEEPEAIEEADVLTDAEEDAADALDSIPEEA